MGRKTTKQSMEQFDWKKQCFYCGADAIKDKNIRIEILFILQQPFH